MNTNIPPELLLAKDRLDQAILIARTPQDADSMERLTRAVINTNNHLKRIVKFTPAGIAWIAEKFVKRGVNT